LEGGGDVKVLPQDNAATLDAFRSGTIAGAWVPEPWASRLVLDGGGKVLVDERALWPQGRYVTTQLVVRADYLAQHPDVVKNVLRGQVETNDFVNAHPDEAKATVQSAIAAITGKKLKDAVIDRAWPNLTFTDDPIASSLATSAASAVKLGLIQPIDLTGIYDL